MPGADAATLPAPAPASRSGVLTRRRGRAAPWCRVQGCVGAVQRVLGRLPGVQHVDIDLEQNKVEVTTDASLSAEAVMATVAKTGKATELWQ